MNKTIDNFDELVQARFALDELFSQRLLSAKSVRQWLDVSDRGFRLMVGDVGSLSQTAT